MKRTYFILLKKITRYLLYFAFLFITVLLLLEVTYRNYWVDFYGGNLKGLNATTILNDNKKPTLLIIGDSFTADQNSYVRGLRNAFPNHRIINSAVPGTCARQHALMMRKRVKQFSPDLFIYQTYVGNDLLDWRHPLSSPNISFLRKCYWWLSDRLYVVGYINTKLPHLRQAIFNDIPMDIDPKVLQAFSPEKYSSRSKMLFQAEPNLVENSVLLKNGRQNDLEELAFSIQGMIGELSKECKVLILPIPHAMQLGDPYLKQFQQIGATVNAPTDLIVDEYPFIKYLQSNLITDRIFMVNPLLALREKNITEPVYYNNDPHLNPVGQEIISDVLVEYLNRLYLMNDER
ncbi:hypothetical protein OAF63_07025 [Saprospiraceae bacterium]|nr:hypothetical protein [Saprospiraceae bacterium]